MVGFAERCEGRTRADDCGVLLLGVGAGGVGGQSSTAVSTVTETSSSSTTSTKTSSTASEGSEDSKAMLILDASSSMVEADAEGTRMESAKKAANELVESLPETANMGLMAYGANESDAPDNRERGCKDVETLANVGKIDKAKFTSAIDGLEPKGYTPMGNSLRKAAEELGDEGERSIILVSDGIDSCAPPPVCEVAKELAEDGVDLAIHTVGFQVDDAARKELQCIAEAGNGQFLEAKDASSLATSLKFLAQRDIGKYKVEGTPFEFADSPESAKWLGEGQYQTKVTPDSNAKTDRYFRVSVPEGYDATIILTPIWQTDGNVHHAKLFVETSQEINEKDPECGRVKTTLGNSNVFGNALFAMEPYRVSLRRNDGQDDCDMSSWLIATQVYQKGEAVEKDVDLEVNVIYEPIPDREQMLEWSDRRVPSERYDGEVPFGTPREITGGTGFNDAVEISEGTYSDNIVPGEFRFYKIPVKWGGSAQWPWRKRTDLSRTMQIRSGFNSLTRRDSEKGREARTSTTMKMKMVSSPPRNTRCTRAKPPGRTRATTTCTSPWGLRAKERLPAWSSRTSLW